MTLAINTGHEAHGRHKDRGAWAVALPCWLVALLALTLVFADTVAGMTATWIGSATYGHGFLIPIISAYLVWRDRDRLASLEPKPALIAILPLAGLSLIWFVANLVDIALIEQFAFAGMLQMATLAILGWRVCRAIVFPIGFLVFMVPFGEFLVFPLQVLTTDFLVYWLRLIEIPVFRDGIFIHLPTGSFEVAEACAGLRFLIATIVLGVLFAYLFFRDWPRRLVFVGLSLAVPIIANGFRALMIVLIAYWTDHEVAVGVDHLVFGWLFLMIVLVLLFGLGMVMRPRLPDEPKSAIASPQGPNAASHRHATLQTPRSVLIGAAVAAVMVPMLGPAYAAWRALDTDGTDHLALSLPPAIDGWTMGEPTDDWQASYHTAHAQSVVRYLHPTQGAVDVYVAYYAHQRDGRELVNSMNRLVPVPADDPGSRAIPWHRVETTTLTHDIGGEVGDHIPRTLQVVEIRRTSGDRRLVLPFYWVGHTLTQSGIEGKLQQLQAIVSGYGDEAAAIVLSVPIVDEKEPDASALIRFLDTLPALTEHLSTLSTS